MGKKRDPHPEAVVSEADRILVDQLSEFMRGCRSVADANKCYADHHNDLARLWKLGGWNRTACIIFYNLRAYQVEAIKKGWIK